MSVNPVLVTGDDSTYEVQLTKNGENFRIASNAIVQASLVDKERKNILIDPVTINENDSGNDWINSLIVVRFNSTDTNAIPSSAIQDKSALLEIQVDDTVQSNGKTTWFYKLKLLKGTIDQ